MNQIQTIRFYSPLSIMPNLECGMRGAVRTPVALRTGCDPTTNHRVGYCVVNAQRGVRFMATGPYVIVLACRCERPFFQVSPPRKCPFHCPPVKRRRRRQLRITFHKPHFFASRSHTYTHVPHQSNMSSFFSCGEDQTAAWTQVAHHNQQAAVPFDGSMADHITVSTGLFRDMEGYSH